MLVTSQKTLSQQSNKMPLTFLESVAGNSGGDRVAPLMEEFNESNPIIPLMSWINEPTSNHEYSQLVELGDAGTRSLNESRKGTQSKRATKYVPYKLFSDISEVDWQISAQNPGRKFDEQLLKMRSFSDNWLWMFFHGSSALNPEEFDGLRAHCQEYPRQHISNNDSGAPLSRFKLRKAISNTRGANAILMGEEIHDWFSESAQTNNTAGIVWRKDELGMDVMAFGGIPIYPIKRDEADRFLLPQTEGSKDLSANDCSSIYVVGMGEGRLQGIQFQGPQGYGFNVKELAQDDVMERTLIEWKTSIVAKDTRSITRLSGVKAGPLTN